MFKILKGTQPGRYSVYCYVYIFEANFYSFLYSARDLEWEDVACLLKGRLRDENDIDWAHSIVRLTNASAVIGEDGVLRAVPIGQNVKEIPSVENRRILQAGSTREPQGRSQKG